MRSRPGSALLASLAFAALLAGCGKEAGTGPGEDPRAEGALQCNIPEKYIVDGGAGRNAIPALSDPETALPGDPGTGYLRPDSRIIGFQAEGRTLAVPHNILWYHEVVNFDLGRRKIAVSFCPLTGSSLIFDREPVDGEELVVSGLLFFNNLIMVPREEGTSLFPQMHRGAACGPMRGVPLTTLPYVEMTWEKWRSLHPETEVVSSNTGFSRNYTVYPYGNYNDPNSLDLLSGLPRVDPRRPPKEKVLGIPAGRVGGLAIPFGELRKAGDVLALRVGVVRGGGVLFWKRRAAGAAVFRPVVTGLPDGNPHQGERLTFEVRGDEIRDVESGSTWTLDGRAVEGPLRGARLETVEDAYTAFWFAWALFQEETEILQLRG